MQRVSSLVASLFVATVLIVGCSEQTKTAKGPDKKKDEKKVDHGGWWCDEHGVPEHLCSLCMSEADQKKHFKDKGDWCEIHKDRAKSQCFKCDPSKYKTFEDMYVAKYNKNPDPPDPDEFKK